MKYDSIVIPPLSEFRKVIACLLISILRRPSRRREDGGRTLGAWDVYSSNVNDPTEVSIVTY